MLLAMPTVAIDVFNAQDITNRDAATFPWTLVITPPQRAAFDWIRQHTPIDAVVQAEPVSAAPPRGQTCLPLPNAAWPRDCPLP